MPIPCAAQQPTNFPAHAASSARMVWGRGEGGLGRAIAAMKRGGGEGVGVGEVAVAAAAAAVTPHSTSGSPLTSEEQRRVWQAGDAVSQGRGREQPRGGKSYLPFVRIKLHFCSPGTSYEAHRSGEATSSTTATECGLCYCTVTQWSGVGCLSTHPQALVLPVRQRPALPCPALPCPAPHC